jgi:hypothetical protein
MIAINLVVNLRNPFANAASYQKFYHMWVWSYAIATTSIMLGEGQVGRSGDGTCWIPENKDKDATNWYQLMFFIPLLMYPIDDHNGNSIDIFSLPLWHSFMRQYALGIQW